MLLLPFLAPPSLAKPPSDGIEHTHLGRTAGPSRGLAVDAGPTCDAMSVAWVGHARVATTDAIDPPTPDGVVVVRVRTEPTAGAAGDLAFAVWVDSAGRVVQLDVTSDVDPQLVEVLQGVADRLVLDGASVPRERGARWQIDRAATAPGIELTLAQTFTVTPDALDVATSIGLRVAPSALAPSLPGDLVLDVELALTR